MTRVLYGLLIGCWLLPVALADDVRSGQFVPSLRVAAAWHGFTKPSVATELMLRIRPERGGAGTVVVNGGGVEIKADVLFAPGTELLMSVPVPVLHQSTGQPSVQVYSNGRLQLTSDVELQQLDPALAVVAVVAGVQTRGAVSLLSSSAQTKALPIPVQALPVFAASYNMLRALIIGTEQLHTLSVGQRQAFNDYLAACGTLVLLGGDERALYSLRSQAGCGGRHVVPTWDEARVALSDVVPATVPADGFLRQLLPPNAPNLLSALLIFVAGYWVILLLVARSVNTPLPLLVVPVLAALLVLGGWSRGQPQLRAVTWAEMDQGDSVLRVETLLDYTGMSRSEHWISFPRAMSLPDGVTQPAVRAVYYQPLQQSFELQLSTRLMSRHAFVLRGSALAPSVLLRQDEHGIEVVNTGSESLPEGTLAWRGKPYRVPVLAPGRGWRPPSSASSWGDAPQDYLLKQRALDDRGWLLLPWVLPVPGFSDGANAFSGWLLVRGDGDA